MDPDKILQAYVGGTQMSCVKILAPWAKWAQNGGEKGACFFVVTSTMNSHFFVMGQIGMKFGQKSSIGVLC